MHDAISFNYRLVSLAEASVSALSSAALYGKGIFTTVAIYDRKPFLWGKHWPRLRDHAAKLGIDLEGYSEEQVRGSLDEIIARNNVVDGRARITFFDERPGTVWTYESGRNTSILIITGDRRSVPENFRVEISSSRISSTSKLSSIKSCNYLDNLLAYEEATKRGFDEALRLNEGGEVTSACMANVFWLKDEKLLTPNLETGCLAGTTRELVMENFPCKTVGATYDQLYKADAIFLTSAGFGVVCVNELEGRKLSGEKHPILRLIPGSKH